MTLICLLLLFSSTVHLDSSPLPSISSCLSDILFFMFPSSFHLLLSLRCGSSCRKQRTSVGPSKTLSPPRRNIVGCRIQHIWKEGSKSHITWTDNPLLSRWGCSCLYDGATHWSKVVHLSNVFKVAPNVQLDPERSSSGWRRHVPVKTPVQQWRFWTFKPEKLVSCSEMKCGRVCFSASLR